ncbi:Abi-alpha family protein [Mycolicibacterium mucogenicum]|uniref:Abi-alpha family protein n=1 Tax=Mycolicibacterium mucogenicum TaxID=56689 RepID=UPI00226A89D0|nr:Abi-alpha family protein [Mycolicibacterium mucogenicum]MCX8560209.1 Abi-alpha family protein [Mycolicibacterium mucogenicum]
MAQSFDPFGLVGRAVDAARLGLDVYSWTEQQIVGALRKGLNELEPEDTDDDIVSAADTSAPRSSSANSAAGEESLNSKMSQLLNRALDQNTAGSQTELYHHLLDQLVADEARIVGALSDGSVSPLVNVYDRTRKPVLENAALVGRTANVALPQMTPQYIGHLLALRLVEIGPEDSALKTDYEVLMAETIVLNAIKAASKGPLPAKVEKLTLTLSPLGRSLWAAATAEDDQNGWR